MKVDARNIKRRFTEWIWDVEYFELQGGGNTTDIETQSNGENDEGHSDYFLDSLTNENSQQEVVSAQIVPRRSARLHKPKACNSCACVATACRKQGSCESVNVHDALKGPDAQKWTDAIAKELENLANKDVWDIVKRPLDRNVIDCRWVLVIKRDPDRHKARLVAGGFWQRPGIDYSETFSPIVKRRTLRILLTLCAENEWCYEHIDVECAYLNSPLDEDIYMEQPDFYKVPGKDRTQYVCKLKKSLYGLKQAGRVWFKYINCILRDMNLNPCVSDPCMYVNTSKDLIVAVYVDDILVFGTEAMIHTFKTRIKEKLDVRMLGSDTQFLSIHLSKPNSTTVVFDQSMQISQMLELFDITQEVGVSTPLAKECEAGLDIVDSEPIDNKLYEQAVGHIMYIATVSRPDVACAI